MSAGVVSVFFIYLSINFLHYTISICIDNLVDYHSIMPLPAPSTTPQALVLAIVSQQLLSDWLRPRTSRLRCLKRGHVGHSPQFLSMCGTHQWPLLIVKYFSKLLIEMPVVRTLRCGYEPLGG